MVGPNELSDETVSSAVGGEPAAVEELMGAIAPQVRLMVAARLGARSAEYSVVDDISQTVCVGLNQSLPSLKNRTVGGFRSFLSTIVARRVADYLRCTTPGGARGRRVASLDSTVGGLTDGGPLWQFLSAGGTSPLSAADRTEQFARVLHGMEQLKREHRAAITYAFFDQLSTAEIAEELNISRPAASMLLIRAVQALRRQLAPSTTTEQDVE